MPLAPGTIPVDLASRTKLALTNINSRLQLPSCPIPVFSLSGEDCRSDLIETAKQSAWRYYDGRGRAIYVDVGVTDLTISSVTQGGRLGLAVPDRIAMIEKRARWLKEAIVLRIVEVPSLKETAIWELRDGLSYSFHVCPFSKDNFEEEAPDVFHKRIAEDWSRLKGTYESAERPELLGG